MTNKFPIIHSIIKHFETIKPGDRFTPATLNNIEVNNLAKELGELLKMQESEDISEERLRLFLASAGASVEDLAIQTLLDLINDRYTIKQMREDIC